MNPFDALGHFAISLIQNHQLQNWCKLAASLVISFIVSMLGIFGTSIFLYHSQGYSPVWTLTLSFGTACTITSGVLIGLWKSDPATKGIPIEFPNGTQIEAQKKGLVFDPNKQS